MFTSEASLHHGENTQLSDFLSNPILTTRLAVGLIKIHVFALWQSQMLSLIN